MPALCLLGPTVTLPPSPGVAGSSLGILAWTERWPPSCGGRRGDVDRKGCWEHAADQPITVTALPPRPSGVRELPLCSELPQVWRKSLHSCPHPQLLISPPQCSSLPQKAPRHCHHFIFRAASPSTHLMGEGTEVQSPCPATALAALKSCLSDPHPEWLGCASLCVLGPSKLIRIIISLFKNS